jgi:prepilin-type N-terminal cleavage/methylation domain-containing protein
MQRQTGFTLVELMVVIAILGIMAAMAMPLYGTYRQKAYGSEALVMLKRIMDAEIMYHLEHERFFPEDGDQPIDIFHDDPPSKAEIQQLRNALHITIPVGQFLDYHIQTFPEKGHVSCTIVVSAPFPIFKNGNSQITGYLHKDKGPLIF